MSGADFSGSNVFIYLVSTRDFLRNVLAPLWRVQPSAALEAGCALLLSEDLQHGQLIEGLAIENPFRA